jgi:hypothetical protein
MVTALADTFAAARLYHPCVQINRQWQTADRTLSMVALIRLFKQTIITYFSHPIFTILLVLRTMIFLTYDATIFHEFASGAQLQFNVIPSRNTTGGTHLLNCLLYAAAAHYSSAMISSFVSSLSSSFRQQESSLQ